ncbi:MFS general substrate transporter [Delitschia confertaspora ATCC 74209]|uniref:MFS general substrate transporter n=1 Tax=Delitschia confertaspora ATCC 74209 TaxID=1513339 RepID=A0A9P4JLN1_9PLEO|nr:MFS general substrate transporter [Delitschia confertaspora ATCC 74209]
MNDGNPRNNPLNPFRSPSPSPSVEEAATAGPSTRSPLTAIPITDIQKTKISRATHLSFAALTTVLFLVALDTVLLPTALPTISHSFHLPTSLYAWTGSAYLLANAAFVPFWGKLMSVFGRKGILMFAIAVFLVGSIVCSVSTYAGMLVAGRTVQGLGGGGVVVGVHICIADMFALRDRSFYLGIVGAVWAVASALGPVLGGIFAQKLNWRWCFYINLPFVTLAAAILFFTLHIPTPRSCFRTALKNLDWTGSSTIILATTLLLLGLQLGGQPSYPWSSAAVLCCLVFGLFFYVLFALSQWKFSPSPIMPLRIFADTSNLSALGVCACDALVFNSVAYFLPLYFQIILSSSPSSTGVLMLSLAIPLAVVSLGAGWVMNRTGHYLLILRAGLALMTVGVGLFVAFPASKNWAIMILFPVVVGIGFGPNFHAPLIALQTRVKDGDIPAGTAAFSFIRCVAGAVGVVLGQVVFQAGMRSHGADFMNVGVGKGFADALAGGDAIALAEDVRTLPKTGERFVVGIMNAAMRNVWIMYTVVSAVGLLISFGIIRERLTREMPDCEAGKGVERSDTLETDVELAMVSTKDKEAMGMTTRDAECELSKSLGTKEEK